MARFKAYISDDDSGDEDQHMDIQKPVSTKEPARKAASPASSVSSEASTEAPSSPEDDTDSLMHEDELLNFPSQGTVLPPTMNKNMAGLDGGRMNAMQASLFHGRPPPPSRKHPRPSESELGTSWEDRDAPIARDSFAQPVVNGTKPGRKYMRGAVTSSAQVPVQDVLETPQLQLPIPVPSSESSYQKYGSVSHLVADAALSQGCSFRASWGPGGLLAIPSASPSGPSIMQIHELPRYSEDEAVVRDTFLPHLLAHAPIQLDEDSIPFVNPEGGSTSLSFSAFAALLPAPTQQIVPGNWLRELFKASSALFDPLPLSSRTSPLQEQLARKKLFSRFLQSSLNPHGTAHSSSSPIDSIFRHLSLHQLERAADAAIESGYPRLALLIAHGGSTTPEFRHEMKEQLRIWRDESISNSYIEPGVRRCYALLSGDTDELLAEGVFAELKGAGGGWKRIFAVLMWFVLPLSASLADVYHAYVSLLNEDFLGLPKPLPPYASMTPDGSSDYTDPIFLLLQLYSVPATSLNSVLDPRNFSPNPLNVGLPWLLGILLNRVWDIRDFEDREKLDTRPPIDMNDETAELPEESADVELGHSPSSDLLTNSYVAALEARQDSLQESIFVALFGEAGVGRKHVITGLLERSGWQLGDEWLLRGLIGSLKLGQGGFGGMVEAAKGCWAFGQGMMWEAYVFWLDAARRGKLPSDVKPRLRSAHSIAVAYLAPDAVLVNDLDLLKSIFEGFQQFVTHRESLLSEDWSRGGGLYLAYVEVISEAERLSGLSESDDEMMGKGKTLTQLRERVEDPNVVRDREELVRKAGKLGGLLPDLAGGAAGAFGGNEVDEKVQVVIRKMSKEVVKIQSRFALQDGHKGPWDINVEEGVRLKTLREGVASRFVRSLGPQ